MLQQTRGLERLAPWKNKKAEAYVRTLTLNIPREAVSRLGDVQGLISAKTSRNTGDVLSANIEESFTAGIEDALKKLPVNAGLERTFETVISRINLMLKRLLGENGLPIEAGSAHGAIVAQKGREMAAAVWGNPSMLLFRPNSPGGAKFIDVLGGEESASAQAQEGFTNLITGKITGKDRMLVSNSDILKLLDEHSIREVLSAPRPETATMLLRDALVSRYENLALAILLLDGAPVASDVEQAKHEPIPVSESARNALSEVLEEKKESVAVTEPPPVTEPEPKPVAAETRPSVSANVTVTDTMGRKMARVAARVAPVARKCATTTARIAREASTKAIELAKNAVLKDDEEPENKAPLAKRAAKASASSKKRSAAAEKAPSAETEDSTPFMQRLSSGLSGFWKGLTPRRKGLFVAALVLLFVTTVSVGAVGWRRSQEKSLAEYEKAVADIKQRIDSAEASMIYRDEDRARTLLQETSAALAALPQETDEQTQTARDLNGILAAKFAELRHAVVLPAPEVISTLATQAGTPHLARMAYASGHYWTVSSAGEVFRVSESDGSAELLHSIESNPEVFAVRSDGLLVGDAAGVDLVGNNGSVSGLTLPTDGLEMTVTDTTTFGSRLYVLDADRNRILRFAATPGGFGTHDFYVKDATDLSGSTSLSIDGYVFVLKPDGQIVRMLRGKSTDFSTSPADPPVTTASRLVTPSDTDDLYVLDGQEGRVVRFDKKTGRLVAQYESDSLKGASDIWVVEDDSTITAANGNRILRFTWTESEE